MIDYMDVICGAICGALISILIPNAVLLRHWSPKTKWGKRRLKKRIKEMG